MGNLKPCPFCGSTDLRLNEYEFQQYPICNSCDAFGPYSDGVDECEAVAAWNRRATPPEVTALVEAATSMRDHIARWHDGGPVAGPEESRALFGALDDALTEWEAAQK